MEKFLKTITKNRKINLIFLRALIYCNFLKDVQLGLYLFGPGGTGKTTFIYTLLYILGPDAAHTTTLNALIKRAVWVKSS